jgi:hypothetical protein
MKLFHLLVSTILVLLLLVLAVSQTKVEPILVDEVYTDNCEDLLPRLDSYSASLAHAKAKGFVLFNLTTDNIRNNFLYQFLQYHRSTRNRGTPLYELVPVVQQGAPLFQMWKGSPGAKHPRAQINYQLNLDRTKHTVFFTGELYERLLVERKITFSEVGSGCSTRSLNLGLLSLFLDSNPGTKAYFTFRGTRKRVNELKNYLIQLLDRSDLSRMRFLYAGSRMINNKQFVEVEIFISRLDTKSAAAFPYNLGSY